MKTGRLQSRTAKSLTTAPERQHSPSQHGKSVEQIAIAAYLRAESRGFEPGHELEDWLAAEMENQ